MGEHVRQLLQIEPWFSTWHMVARTFSFLFSLAYSFQVRLRKQVSPLPPSLPSFFQFSISRMIP